MDVLSGSESGSDGSGSGSESEVDDLLEEANRHYARKEWDDAITQYKECIAVGLIVSDTDKSNVYYRLATAYEEESNGKPRDESAALEWYTKLIALG